MAHLEKPAPIAALLPLVALAGCVDAIGWLRLEGLFVSFMSGVSTMVAVAGVGGDFQRAIILGIAVAMFVAGALGGFLLGRATGRWRSTCVLGVVAALLTAAWQLPFEATWLPPAAWALLPAMGVLNAALPGVHGITAVTGALTRGAETVIATLAGETGTGWPRQVFSWVALVVGAAAGALVLQRWPVDALAAPAAFATAACLWALVAALRADPRPTGITVPARHAIAVSERVGPS